MDRLISDEEARDMTARLVVDNLVAHGISGVIAGATYQGDYWQVVAVNRMARFVYRNGHPYCIVETSPEDRK